MKIAVVYIEQDSEELELKLQTTPATVRKTRGMTHVLNMDG